MNILQKTMNKAIRCCIVLLVFLPAACGDKPQLPKLDGDAVILAFGDSLTEGKGAKREQSYPAVLERLSNRKVINAGVSGEVSAKGLERLPGLLDSHKPDLLILCHGGNDILQQKKLDQTANNIRRMIKHARERGIPVVMLGVPRFGLFLSTAEIYPEIAESTGVIFMKDLIPDILGDRSLKSDNVHPNADGYRRMAEAIHKLLQKRGAI